MKRKQWLISLKEEDKRIKEVTKERNMTLIERKKQIAQDRKATDEYAEIHGNGQPRW